MAAKRDRQDGVDQIKALADVLRDPMFSVHDPAGYARSYVAAALLIESDPGLLRRHAERERLGAERIEVLRELPRLGAVEVPDSQRSAVRVMRELTTRVTSEPRLDPHLVAQIVTIHRRYRGGSHYDRNLGPKRAGIAQAFMEQPARRRRRQKNPTPQLSRLGVGEATERVKRALDRLIAGERSGRGDVAGRAREVQVIAELIFHYPAIIERPYLQKKLGVARVDRARAMLGLASITPAN